MDIETRISESAGRAYSCVDQLTELSENLTAQIQKDHAFCLSDLLDGVNSLQGDVEEALRMENEGFLLRNISEIFDDESLPQEARDKFCEELHQVPLSPTLRFKHP